MLLVTLPSVSGVPTALAAQQQQPTTRPDSTGTDSSAANSPSSTQQLLWDTEPPTVFVSPPGGTFSSASLSVIIDWEDDTQIDDGTITIFFNGSNIAGSFTYTSRGIDRGTSTGTVTLQPGSNTLVASIFDLAGHKGSKTVTYTLQAAPPTVTVTPSGLAEGDTASSYGAHGDSLAFSVHSTGGPSGGSTYNLTASCSGDAIDLPCTLSPSSLAISPGSSKTAWVKFTTTAVAALTGRVELTARYALDATVKDSSWVAISTTLPCTATLGSIEPCTAFQDTHTGRTYTQYFRVTNGNHLEDVTYLLTAITRGVGIQSVSVPNSIIVPKQSSALVAVTYTTVDSAALASLTGGETARATITLSADDGMGPVAGTLEASVALPPPPPAMHRVALSPHYTTMAHADRSKLYTTSFHVTNAGTDTATYRYTLHCTGIAVVTNCDGGAKPDTISLGIIQPESTSVFQAALTTTSASGAAGGELHVAVWRAADLTTRDSATVAVTLDSSSPSDHGIADLDPGSTMERSLCLGISLAPGHAWECGDLRVAIATSGIASVGKWRSPVLIYNSAHARPEVTVRARVTLPSDGRVPDSVVARLMESPSGAELARGKWSGSDWTAGSTRQIALSFDASGGGSSHATGLYPYALESTRFYAAGPESDTTNGILAVVDRGDSPFGTGWWLAGLEQLHDQSDGAKLWVAGDGSTRRYAADAGDPDVFRTESLYRPDSMVRSGSGASTQYTRYLAHGVTVIFDALGRHVATTDRLGRSTHFYYDGATSLVLDSIVVPTGTAAGSAFHFRYDTLTAGGSSHVRLMAIEAPPIDGERRVDSLVVDGASLDVTAIVRPDGRGSSFAYTTAADAVGAHRMKSSTDERGKITKFTYDALGYLVKSTLGLAPGDSIEHAFHTAMARGRAGTPAVPLDLAYASHDGPRTDVGDSTLFWIDRFGAPERIRNALGDETTLERNDGTFAALVTRVRSPGGQVSGATYDSHGNVTSMTDSTTYMDPDGSGPLSATYATTRYAWDMKWDFATKTVNPAGDSSMAAYDATTGNMLWSEDGRGSMSRTSFNYYPSSHGAHGLLRSVVYPGQPSSEGDSLSYDAALLNLAYTVDAAERVTSYSRDALGQVTGVTHPSAITERHYLDILGRDTLSITTDTISGADTAWVRSHYDVAGNLDTLYRKSMPDRAGIGTLTQAFAYDAANRKIAETLLGGPSGSEIIEWEYDLAGNLVSGGRRPTRNRYDALNRLVRKSGSDVSTFVYDAAGNILAADNPSARVSRSYNTNGTLRSDTLRIATRSGSNFSQHVYDLHYEYDINGRRSSLALGTGSGAKMTDYEYETATGRLSAVTGSLGHRYTVGYDSSGRVQRIVRLAGETDSIVETRKYDKLSRLLRRIQWSPASGDTLHSDSLLYNRHDKVASNAFTTDNIGYDALGYLTGSQLGDAPAEQYAYDALGHRSYSLKSGTEWMESNYSYIAGTERLALTHHPTLPDPDTTYYFMDAVDGALGEERWVHHFRVSGGCPFCSTKYYEQRATVNFYDAERRLVKSIFHLDTLETPTTPYPDPHYKRYSRTERYRYDALGRRVWTEMVRDTNCTNHDRSSGCRNYVTRTVWDGDQIIEELRANPDTSVGAPEPETSAGPHYGRVTYTYLGSVLGIDAPVALEKSGQLVVPLDRWNGSYDKGRCPGSLDETCATQQVDFPVATAYGEALPYFDGPPSWHGTVIGGMRDGSGYIYRRNRYYDPKTGQFTQQDPIGLAGGLNLYGYANGDPVSYSDPFGLCPEGLSGWKLFLCSWIEAAATAAGADIGGQFGGELGALVAVPTGGVAAPVTVAGGAALGAAGGAAVGNLAGHALTNVLFSENSAGNQSSGKTANLQRRLDEHRQKLSDYRRDPDAFDNQGLLKNAPSDEVRQRIIQGRIRHLEQEIRAFEKAIRDAGGTPR